MVWLIRLLFMIGVVASLSSSDVSFAHGRNSKKKPQPTPPPIEQACPNPKHPEWPSLAFTVRAWDSSGLDKCEEKIRLAKEMGFTAIQFAINYSFNPATRVVTALPGMLEKLKPCFKVAAAHGLDVQYAPHLSFDHCEPNASLAGANCWRAWTDVWPDLKKDFLGTPISPFLEFLRENPSAFSKNQSTPKAELLLASELEKSLSWHPNEWTNVIQTLKSSPEISLHRVQVGIAPNYSPHCWAKNCADMARLYEASDFIAPSVYGNFATQTTSERIEELPDLQLQRGHCKQSKEIRKLVKSKMGIGEYGFGGSFNRAEDFSADTFIQQINAGINYTSYQGYQKLRKAHFADLLQNMRNGNLGPNRIAAFWTADIHDFTGISPDGARDQQGNLFHASTTQADLIDLIRGYSAERCGKLSSAKTSDQLINEAERMAHSLSQPRPRFAQWLENQFNPNCATCQHQSKSAGTLSRIADWFEQKAVSIASDNGADLMFCK